MSQYIVPKRKNEDETEAFRSKPSETSASSASHKRTATIPGFVTKTPWYLQQQETKEGGDEFSHQRAQTVKTAMESSSVSIAKGSLGDIKTRFVAGACENCGSTSHKRKDCLERPRKMLAKYSGEKLASDDIRPDNETDRTSFEAKRDRWRGFVPSDVDDVNVDAPSTSVSNKTLDKEGTDAPGPIRERKDTVKYLLNMDDDSKVYDPKSRSLINSASGGFDKATVEDDSNTRKLAWEK